MSLRAGVWGLLSLIWGSSWLFIKLGLRDLPPLSFAALRFVVAAAALGLAIGLTRGQRLRLGDAGFIAGTGFLTFTVSYGLVFWGQQHISSGLGALLFSTFPLFGLLLAHRVLPAERLSVRRTTGVVLGIAGVGVVFSDQLSGYGPLAVWGSGAVLMAALASACADVAIKRHGGHLDPAVLTFGQMLAGAMPLLVAGVVLEGSPFHLRWTPRAVLALLYLGLVSSALAFVLLYWLIQRIDVTKTMLITLLTPFIAVLLGVAILDEVVTWRIAAGGAAILGGVAVTMGSPLATGHAREGRPTPATNQSARASNSVRRRHRAETDGPTRP